jgi:hypothetical protein
MTLCVAFLLFHFMKDARKSVLNTLAFFLACLFVQFISSLLYALQFATIAHAAGMCGVRSPDEAFVRIATGMELGLTPMQSLRGVHVINGRPQMSADMMVGVCLSRPEVCEYFQLVESSPERAVYRTKRRGSPEPVTLVFTIEDAKRAGLLGSKTWIAHPAAMLRARCSSQLARAVYPDLVNGLYTEDEMQEIASSSPAASAAPIVSSVTVVEPAPPAADTSAIEAALRAAATLDELKVAAAPIRSLPKGSPERSALVAAYNARKLELETPAPAPAPEPAREPGSDDA